MLNLRSVIAQVHRSIGSRRNFCSSPPPVTSSKKEVTFGQKVFSFGQGAVTSLAGWVLYKDYKDNSTLSRNFFEHHEKDQVPEVKEEIEAMKKRQSLLQEEIETMKIQFLMEKKNSG